jgi:hypothetical protein
MVGFCGLCSVRVNVEEGKTINKTLQQPQLDIYVILCKTDWYKKKVKNKRKRERERKKPILCPVSCSSCSPVFLMPGENGP